MHGKTTIKIIKVLIKLLVQLTINTRIALAIFSRFKLHTELLHTE
jgi:hypothetical protein